MIENKIKNLSKIYETDKEILIAIRTLYDRIKFSCKRQSRPKQFGGYTFQTFINWCLLNDFERKYYEYKITKNKNKKPSVDRIDPKKGYLFNNMQLVTQEYNFKKGYLEMSLIRGKPVLQINKNGEIIKEWNCVNDVYKHLGISDGNIWSVIRGKRSLASGYKWKLKFDKDY